MFQILAGLFDDVREVNEDVGSVNVIRMKKEKKEGRGRLTSRLGT